MPIAIISSALFGLFYINLLPLLGLPGWPGLLAVAPVWVLRYRWPLWEARGMLWMVQGSLLVGMLCLAAITLARLLAAEPLLGYRLLPLLVAVVVLYLLFLHLRWRALDDDDAALSYWVAGPSLLMSFAVSVMLSVYLLFALGLLGERVEALAPLADKFVGRGLIPPITLTFFCWAALILASKWGLLRIGSKHHLESLSDEQIAVLWQHSAESYLIPKYLNWSIPILGFIGTVLGISLAADGIRRVLAGSQGAAQMSSDLGQVIAPLGIAFDTTLIALSLSIVLTLLQTLQQRDEDRLLNSLGERA